MKVVIENSLGPQLVAKIYHDVKLVIIAPMIYVLTKVIPKDLEQILLLCL